MIQTLQLYLRNTTVAMGDGGERCKPELFLTLDTIAIKRNSNPDPDYLLFLIAQNVVGAEGNRCSLLDGKVHTFKEIWPWIGTRKMACRLMGLGRLLNLFHLTTPESLGLYDYHSESIVERDPTSLTIQLRDEYRSKPPRNAVLRAVQIERDQQDASWGGPSHDDIHSTADFVQYIQDYAGWARITWGMTKYAEARKRLIQVAALAVAAVESLDRQHDQLPKR